MNMDVPKPEEGKMTREIAVCISQLLAAYENIATVGDMVSALEINKLQLLRKGLEIEVTINIYNSETDIPDDDVQTN